ncbi:MAG: hypothetical protein FWG79_08410 [Bacteroidales bacterium]|nr:hypothetical protein [Bacteroidales bacterium]
MIPEMWESHTLTEIGIKFGVDHATISYHAKLLGLGKKPTLVFSEKRKQKLRKLTIKQQQELIEMYPNKTYKEMSTHFGLSENGICRYAKRLGLSKPRGAAPGQKKINNGAERVRKKDNLIYIWVDGKWKQKHRVVYANYFELKAGQPVYFVDGNNRNFDISNLITYKF